MTSRPAIRVDGLVKHYDGRRVLDGVSLSVAPGELVALLGPNGAGKTTTVEIIEGYRRLDGGDVRVLDTDPAVGGAALRARVGLMLQGGGVDPRARPREILRLFGRFHLGGRDPDALLATVGLDTVAQTPYRRLSGGERQRLGLALALVGRPEVLVLDEPTAGMDPEARAVTRGIVSEARDQGVAILLTSHDLADVERLADRVVVIDRGRVVAAGRRPSCPGGSSRRSVCDWIDRWTRWHWARSSGECGRLRRRRTCPPPGTPGGTSWRVSATSRRPWPKPLRRLPPAAWMWAA